MRDESRLEKKRTGRRWRMQCGAKGAYAPLVALAADEADPQRDWVHGAQRQH